jgi:Cysteine rich repeat
MAVVCQPSLLRAVCIALLMVVAIGAGSDAFAQRPSQAQINAMRQSCRSDYMAHCSSVPTGGAPALNCLKQNLANLSPGCQTAIKAIAPESPPAAASTASPSQAVRLRLRQVCPRRICQHRARPRRCQRPQRSRVLLAGPAKRNSDAFDSPVARTTGSIAQGFHRAARPRLPV